MDNIDVVSQYASPPHPPASLEVLLLVQSYLHSNNLEMPCSITDALSLYITLTHHFSDYVICSIINSVIITKKKNKNLFKCLNSIVKKCYKSSSKHEENCSLKKLRSVNIK